MLGQTSFWHTKSPLPRDEALPPGEILREEHVALAHDDLHGHKCHVSIVSAASVFTIRSAWSIHTPDCVHDDAHWRPRNYPWTQLLFSSSPLCWHHDILYKLARILPQKSRPLAPPSGFVRARKAQQDGWLGTPCFNTASFHEVSPTTSRL